MKKLFLLFIATIMISGLLVQNVTAVNVKEKEPELHARAALLMDADSGRVLYEKDGYTPYAVASTTKILTAVLILEADVGEEYATVSSKATSQPKVKLYVKKGERYKVKDLMYSLLLESHNDTAVVLAEHVAGSVEAFAELMNQKAAELGCKSAHFITPNGLDAEDAGGANQASAYDMALITAYALENEAFRDIITTRSYSFSDEKGKRSETVTNANRFLDMYEGAIGVKTGFTNLAGYCFVGATEGENGRIIAVVLGCGWPPNQNWKWSDTKGLMDYGSANFERQTLRLETWSGLIEVENGTQKQIAVRCAGSELGYPVCAEDEVKEAVFMEAVLSAPLKKGEEIGWKAIYVNQEQVLRVPILLQDDCSKKEWVDSFLEIMQMFFL